MPESGRENGILVGIVIDLDDPDRLGRVKVKFPTLNDQESNWARIARMMAGPERGSLFQPEVDDEVLVCFEHGDPRRPYILGGLWSTSDKPPADDGKPIENNWRLIRSRSGHIFKFDDTNNQEKIEIVDSSGKHTIVIDSANDKIQVTCNTGDVEVSAGAGKVSVTATTVEIKATGSMTLEATGTMTIKGATVNIN